MYTSMNPHVHTLASTFITSKSNHQYIHLRHTRPQFTRSYSSFIPRSIGLPSRRSSKLKVLPTTTMPKPKSPTRPHQDNTQAAPTITLRIAGLGHHFELPIESTATLLELKQSIEKQTDLAPEYQRLVAKHKSMEDDGMVLGGTIYNESGVQSIGIGLVDRTKILLLHSAQYTQDKAGVDALTALNKEIDEVDAKRISRQFDNVAVHELITQLCCKIDGVETNGSEALRRMRRGTIRRAEGVAKKSDESKRGIDP